MNLHSIIPTILIKQASEEYKLYYFEGRNTGIAARSEEEARAKKKRGGDKLVAVRTPSDSEKRLMESGKWVRTRYDGKPPGKSEVEGPGMGPPLKKKSNTPQDPNTNRDFLGEQLAPTSASNIANTYEHTKKLAMRREAAQATFGGKRVLTKPGPLKPQLGAVGKVVGPAAAAIDTAILVASPQARQEAVNDVERNATLNPALRMGLAYMDPVRTGYGISAQTKQMVDSNNAALRSAQNYSNALDKRTANAYYNGYRNHVLADKGLYTYPKTTRNQQNSVQPVRPQPVQDQIVKRSFVSFFRKAAAPKFDPFKGKSQELIRAIFSKNKEELSRMGRAGAMAREAKRKAQLMEINPPPSPDHLMRMHLKHPDTKHFLSILEKDASVLTKSAVLGFKALTGHTGPIKSILREIKGRGIKINRVKPPDPAARSPHTEHLPVGESIAKLNKNILEVGKGKPRMHIEKTPAGYNYLYDGVKGGTNPSPIASFLHEGGHFLHAGAVKNSPLARRADASWLTKEHGSHWVKGQEKAVNTVIDELGANNAAIQALRQSGATPEAIQFYATARKPSFYTYFPAINNINTPVANRLKAIGQEGYTSGFKGLDELYNI
jgi:hypothetical protein